MRRASEVAGYTKRNDRTYGGFINADDLLGQPIVVRSVRKVDPVIGKESGKKFPKIEVDFYRLSDSDKTPEVLGVLVGNLYYDFTDLEDLDEEPALGQIEEEEWFTEKGEAKKRLTFTDVPDNVWEEYVSSKSKKTAAVK